MSNRRKKTNPHGGLHSGHLDHKCDSQHAGRAIKAYILDDPGDYYITIARKSECNHGVYNFSAGVQSSHHMSKPYPTKLAPDDNTVMVFRDCSAHANYHRHVTDYFRPFTAERVISKWVLDRLEDVKRAHKSAMQMLVQDPWEVREQWQQGRLS